jgi:hypothetical protein
MPEKTEAVVIGSGYAGAGSVSNRGGVSTRTTASERADRSDA